ncbi:MAG: formyltransferase [Planctomycetota bacterium]
MSVVVLAYHEMGCAALRLLLRLEVEVSAVFTYEDDPQENCWFGSVADVARAANIPTMLTESINEPEWVDALAQLRPDVIFSFYYRHLIKRPIREIPRFGAVNLHGSLLPRYRGRCPVNWQLIHGETESGVTLHVMTGRADAGDIIGQERVSVGPDDTALDLYRKLVPAAERLLEHHLEGLLSGTFPRSPQDESQATVFGGRRPEDGRVEWTRSSKEIHNLVRAVAPPWPGAFSDSPHGRWMIWRTRLVGDAPRNKVLRPGELGIEERRIFAGTGDGLLELLDFQPPAGRTPRSGERLE